MRGREGAAGESLRTMLVASATPKTSFFCSSVIIFGINGYCAPERRKDEPSGGGNKSLLLAVASPNGRSRVVRYVNGSERVQTTASLRCETIF